jgi:formylglycine-generating enzyme required for sulfatase activity
MLSRLKNAEISGSVFQLKNPPAPVELVHIPAGTFLMGSPASEPGRYSDEVQHSVTVSAFNMSNYLVTQKEYRYVMGRNPSYFKGDNLPVDRVSWYDAIKYCNRRSQREGLTPAYTRSGDTVTWNRSANGYRLPTEAEWEYACRAGTTTPYYTGNFLDRAGWYSKNSGWTTHPVGEKEPNKFGLYDMHGNVWEWCWDWYEKYDIRPQTDPVGPATGLVRVSRGGSWLDGGGYGRSADRARGTPANRDYILGLRLVRNPG